MKLSIHLHAAGLSLSETVSVLDQFGVERCRSTIHNWVQKADLQPTSDTVPNQIAVDETVIRVNGEWCWLYAAVNPVTNEFLHSRLFQTLTTQLTLLFLRDFREKQQVEHATFLVDGAQHLQTALTRLGLRFQYVRHGNRNRVDRVFHEVKRRTSAFSNAFRNAKRETAESWLQAFAVWHNSC